MRELPIKFDLDEARRLRTATLKGVIREEDIRTAYASLFSHPDYDPTYNDLVDLRGVERLEMSSPEVRRLADFVGDSELIGERPGNRVAIVAPRDDLFGMARMYQSLRFDAPQHVRVFREFDDAVNWLGYE